MQYLIDVILIGLICSVYIHYLTGDGDIMYKYYLLLTRLPEWVAKPLGLCEYCLSGQIALWYYILTYKLSISIVAYVSGAILMTNIFNKLNLWLKKN